MEGTCLSACLVGNDLFCSISGAGGGELVRVGGDTGEAAVLLEVAGGGELIRVDGDTGEATALFEVQASMLNAAEGSVYFLDLSDGTINRCSLDGRIRERISGNRARDFNVAGGWVFYHNEEDGGRLWCVRLDGANDQPVPSGR